MYQARQRPDGRRHAGRHAGPRHGHADVLRRLRARDRRRGLPAGRRRRGRRSSSRSRCSWSTRWYVKAPLRGRPVGRRRGPRAAALPSLRRRPHRRRPTARPRLRVVNLQVLVALGLIIVGAVAFVDAVGHVATSLGVEPGAARPRHRADRHRAAREVQLDHLGPPGQGHAGDGQHHRRDGLPVGDPGLGRADLRAGELGRRAGSATSPSRRPASRSWRAPRSSCRCARTGRLRGRGLLIGGAFYVAYLVIVGIGISQRLTPSRVRARTPGGITRASRYTPRTSDPPRPRPPDIRGASRMLTEKPEGEAATKPAARHGRARRPTTSSPTSRATTSRSATPRSAS